MDVIYNVLAQAILDKKLDKETAVKTIRDLKQLEKNDIKDIAIVGIGVKLSNADTLEELWKIIASKTDCVKDLPEIRKQDMDEYFHYINEEEKEIVYGQGAYIDRIDTFDHKYFNFSPKEASLLDPNLRLYLETTIHSIENAGWTKEKLYGSNTGVFLGFVNEFNNYAKMIENAKESDLPIGLLGNFPALIPSRISYMYNLKGPSILVDSACSASMSALNTACESIRNRTCSQAIVSGIRLSMYNLADNMMNMGIESADGRTRAMDERSDGAGFGEGVISVVIKPLKDAEKDGDRILSVIKACHLNNDGETIGLTAPNPKGQCEVIFTAYQNAGLNPENTGYMELHGTATKLGDPIEIHGIKDAFSQFTDKKQFCAVSSIKSNFGHLYESSGLLSVVKATLALRYQKIPPTLYFSHPNEKIDFINSPVYVNTKLRDWKVEPEKKRLCSVSSFGMSRTNCHVILEEYPREERQKSVAGSPYIFVLSAKNESVLQNQMQNYISYLKDTKEQLGDICYSAAMCRDHYDSRISFLVRDTQELIQKLEHSTEALRKEEREQLIEKWSWNGAALDETCTDLEKISEWYCFGAKIPWQKLSVFNDCCFVDIPLYSFEQSRCWLEYDKNKKRIKKSEEGYLETVWERTDELLQESVEERIFVITTNTEAEEEIIEQLKAKAGDVVVFTTPEFVEHLKKNPAEDINKIIYLPTINKSPAEPMETEADKKFDTGFYQLLELAKVIENVSRSCNIQLILLGKYTNIVDQKEKYIEPINCSAFALARVISCESTNMNCKCIDYDNDSDVQLIFRELFSASEHKLVALRENNRYIPVLKKFSPQDYGDSQIRYKDGGIYFITGGTGGIALEIARDISRKNSVKFVLVSRSKFPEKQEWERIQQDETNKYHRKVLILNEMIENNSEVYIYQADISQYEQLKDVIQDVNEKIGAIDGVLHCAGNPGKGFLSDKTEREIENVISAKMKGTDRLDKIIDTKQLDFLVLFSSGASMIGEMGQGDYAAANGYLDGYYQKKVREGQKNIKCINWTMWKETGMSFDTGDNKDREFLALSTDEALKLFHTVMKKEIGKAILGKMNYKNEGLGNLFEQNIYRIDDEILSNFNAVQKGVQQAEEEQSLKEVILTGRAENDYTETEQQVAQCWNSVLGGETYNITDNFYELGGDSILALRIINKINYQMDIHLKTTALLENLTIESLAAFIDEYKKDPQGENNASLHPVVKVEDREYYPLSSAQKRMYTITARGHENKSYNITKMIKLNGEVNIEQFNQAIQFLITRHEALRTSFVMQEEVVQKIHEDAAFSIDYEEAMEEQIYDIFENYVTSYDLSKYPLIRIKFVKINESLYYIIIDMHHIISDGASMDIFAQELAYLINGSELPKLEFQYKDYVQWQETYFDSAEYKKQENYWLNQYEDCVPSLKLITDFKRDGEISYLGDKVWFYSGEERYHEVNRFIRKNECTLFMVLVSAYYILLQRNSENNDITIALPVIARPKEEFENCMGLFVNTLLLRNKVDENMKVSDFIQMVKKSCKLAYENQDYQFEHLADQVMSKRTDPASPLVNTMFSMLNVGEKMLEINGIEFSVVDYNSKVSKFDLSLEAVEVKQDLKFVLEYSTDVYQKQTVEAFGTYYLMILEEMVKNPDALVKEIGQESDVDESEISW